MLYIKPYSYINGNVCLHLQSVMMFCGSTLYPDRVYFQWYILNVNKIKVVACFCKVICNFCRYVSNFACVKFQTNLISFCWIIAIDLRGPLFSGHSVQYRWFHATCIYVIKMPRVYVYFCLRCLDSTLSYDLRRPDHVLYARNVTFYNFSFPCLTSFTCPHVETFCILLVSLWIWEQFCQMQLWMLSVTCMGDSKLRPYLPSVLWYCWLGLLTRKIPSLIWPIMCLVGH